MVCTVDWDSADIHYLFSTIQEHFSRNRHSITVRLQCLKMITNHNWTPSMPKKGRHTDLLHAIISSCAPVYARTRETIPKLLLPSPTMPTSEVDYPSVVCTRDCRKWLDYPYSSTRWTILQLYPCNERCCSFCIYTIKVRKPYVKHTSVNIITRCVTQMP